MIRAVLFSSALLFIQVCSAGEIAPGIVKGAFFCDRIASTRAKPLNTSDPSVLMEELKLWCDLGRPFSFTRDMSVSSGISMSEQMIYCCTHN